MTIVPAMAAWFVMLVSGVATVFTAILAGRTQRMWQLLLLLLEMVLLGAALVSWMFGIWFMAKTLIATGMAASTALLLSISSGTTLAVLTGVGSPRLIRIGYAAFGVKARFDSDFGNSLWLRRSGTWRPKDFMRP